MRLATSAAPEETTPAATTLAADTTLAGPEKRFVCYVDGSKPSSEEGCECPKYCRGGN